MKLNVWILCALAPLAAVALHAQDTSATLETAPAAPTRKAPGVKKKVVLDPPVPAIVKNANVNVRGRASFTGETLGHLQKGQTVTVLEQITLSRVTKDEPAEWAQIAMPSDIPVWVDADFINGKGDDVKARRVNLRGGPGENYSILGRLERGAPVKEIKREKGWVEIEAPTNAYAYVAAAYLDLQPAPAPAPVVVTAPSPVPTPVTPPDAQGSAVNNPAPPVTASNTPASPAPVVSAPAAPVAATPAAPAGNDTDRELQALRQAETNAAAGAPASPAANELLTPAQPETPRVVTREGFVHRAYNIQAPADFELHDVQSGRLIDFLQPKKGQKFKIFVGTHVIVTGPEGVDPRWPRVPLLQVESVDLAP
ncbi:MAG TPA: SH3 domain-containing protein [Verrucomicrobiae bacterium]|jgi:uncharacterized protein YgiM (DUF1202 family)